ncbi:DUF2793 domain-containing protein [Salaquimonas pukyongi]|uniref:DUF2793 domain-containing protein n=1 Tax=Salaquimonas pukyongi TaxID=2712698 RepID=UPI00096B9F40|nr:DUF2793 domain-containing protein [Salaquimonas pukyongi]
MEISSKLALPYLLPQQAQKHVTHNEALRMLDALVQLSVKRRDDSGPPASPAEGDRYALSGSPTGVWEGQGGKIAAFQDGAWAFFVPQTGWILWDEEEEETLVWDGSGWRPAFSMPSSLDGLTGIGINTAPDANNLLAVKSDAILFSHDDATPGSGDVRQVLNKATAADTASTLFQTGFSGRAEFGLTGDDDWHVKVSADGTNWKEALVADGSTGYLGVGTNNPYRPVSIDMRGFPELGAGQAGLQIVGEKGSERAEFKSIVATGIGAPNAAFQGYGARGTIDSPSATLDNDKFFQVLGSGYDGTQFVVPLACSIEMRADGDWSTSSHGGFIRFLTTPAGSTVSAKTERLRITSTGNIGIGTSAPTCRLDVAGPARVGAYTVSTVPNPSTCGAGAIIYVSDETGGAVLAFSDGANWRRTTDRAVVS